MSSRGIHVLGLAETWLKPNVSDGEVLIPHYTIYRKDRFGQHGGGVAMYCHDSLHVRRRHDLEADHLEVMWLELGSGHQTLLLGCLYRPPNKPVAYWDQLESNIEMAWTQQCANMVMLGDFNVDFTPPLSNSARPLQHILERFSLENYVRSPTRVTATSASMIDLFLSTSRVDGVCETVFTDISDHNAILARVPAVQTSRGKTRAEFKSTRRLCRVNWEQFNTDLVAHLQQRPATDQVDDMAEFLNSAIITVLDDHAPVVLRRKRQTRPCPWLTEELVNAVRDRNALHRRLMRDRGNPDLQEQHRVARSKARKLDRTLRNRYFIAKCTTSDQRKLWAVMNVVTGRKRQKQVPQAPIADLSDVFGQVVTDPGCPPTLITPSGPGSRKIPGDDTALAPPTDVWLSGKFVIDPCMLP